MEKLSVELESLVEELYTEFNELDEAITEVHLSSGEWSLKEIIGHLVDSASNNHQRFIRLQIGDGLEFPGYDQEKWLAVEKHGAMPFMMLFTLFLYYNRLISWIIKNLDERCLQNSWITERDDKRVCVTLETLVNEYVDHLRWHLDHFRKRLKEIQDAGINGSERK